MRSRRLGIRRLLEAVGDRGRLAPVGGVELVQDVGDVDADRLDADHQLVGDLAVSEAARDQVQDLGLARRQVEQGGLVRDRRRWRGIEPGARREQLDVAQERPRADPRGGRLGALQGP
jgi:hypothetical protein